MKLIHFYIYLCLVLLFQSCDIINPSEKAPTYIKIDSVIISEEILSLGIVDVWINIVGNAAGVFEIPAFFPLIAETGEEIQIRAGIKSNGMLENRIKYPFYTTYVENPEFIEGETVSITPVFDYVEEKVIYGQDFEAYGDLSHFDLETTSISDTSLIETELNAIYGSRCGAIFLEGDAKKYFGKFSSDFNLDKKGSPVFLEIDYKCNNDFKVGLYVNHTVVTNQVSIITIFKSENWNKIYIELASILQNYQNANSFSFYIEADKSDEVEKAEIYLDNIKLIKF